MIPFLPEAAAASTLPGRGADVELLASIGGADWDEADKVGWLSGGRLIFGPALRAVAAACPRFVELLADPDPDVGRAILLACRGNAQRVVAVLQGRLLNEADAAVRASVIAAVTIFGRPPRRDGRGRPPAAGTTAPQAARIQQRHRHTACERGWFSDQGPADLALLRACDVALTASAQLVQPWATAPSMAQVGRQEPADSSEPLAIAQIWGQRTADICARYIRLVRFSFLILIGRFATLDVLCHLIRGISCPLTCCASDHVADGTVWPAT